MRSFIPMALACATLACACGEKVQETEDAAPCGVTVVSMTPEDGAVDVSWRAEVLVTLSAPDATASIMLVGPDGAVAGTTIPSETDPAVLTFEPDPALSGLTTYTASVGTCGEGATWSFTTENLGDPTTSPLIDRAWLLGSYHVVAPDIITIEVIVAMMPEILLGVVGESKGTLDILLGWADTTPEGETIQDVCTATLDFPGTVDYSGNPYFLLDAPEYTLDYGTTSYTFTDVRFEGTFTADGTSAEDGALLATVDTRALPETGITPDEMCADFADVGDPCEPCPDGESYCFLFSINNVSWIEVPGLVLQEISEVTDPDCSNI